MKLFTPTLFHVIILSLGTLDAFNGAGFTLGRLDSDLEEIFNTTEGVVMGSKYCVTNYFKTYTTKNNRIIRRVECESLGDYNDASAAVVAGGPGYPYVTVAYTVPRSGSMEFQVKIYG